MPFSFGGHLNFIQYIQKVYNPDFWGFTWNKIKANIYKYQCKYYYFLCCYFAYFDGKINMTSDMDCSPGGNDYFTITSH